MTDAARTAQLAGLARRLLSLHVPGHPLVLPNAWDAASARAVEAAGFPAVATASAAVSASLGYPDHEGTPRDEMFAAIGRMCRAVSVPVTADIEAGYGLSAPDLVARLLDAGAVGCNIEDTAHPADALVEVGRQCERIAAIRDAAASAGVPIVLNARVDSFELGVEAFADHAEEALRRAVRYREAGADCVYPIMLTDEPTIARFVDALGGMVNLLAQPEAAEIARFAALGVARISTGPRVFRRAMREAEAVLRDLASSDPGLGAPAIRQRDVAR